MLLGVNMTSLNKLEAYIEETKRKLRKALEHLQYSYNKINKLSTNVKQLNEEELETWESFSARFSRVSDMYLTKYLRSSILLEDPGFTGTMRDFIHQGEKLDLIDDANAWMMIRGLRNLSAHDYTEKEIKLFFEHLKAQCPRLLAIKEIISK